jgi:hypothetical protein
MDIVHCILDGDLTPLAKEPPWPTPILI